MTFKDGFCLATFGVFDVAVLQLYIFAGVVLGLVQFAVRCWIGVCILFFVIEMIDSFKQRKKLFS